MVFRKNGPDRTTDIGKIVPPKPNFRINTLLSYINTSSNDTCMKFRHFIFSCSEKCYDRSFAKSKFMTILKIYLHFEAIELLKLE